MDGFCATPTGLIITGEPTFEVWLAYGEKLQEIGRALPFIIGDYLQYGEWKWGEGFSQVMDTTGLAEQTLTNYKSVARRVPIEMRRPELTFSVHAAVASLPDEEKVAWLDRAEAEGLGSKDVRRERQINRGVTPTYPVRFTLEELDALLEGHYDKQGMAIGSALAKLEEARLRA